jgi:hypothetical protein
VFGFAASAASAHGHLDPPNKFGCRYLLVIGYQEYLDLASRVDKPVGDEGGEIFYSQKGPPVMDRAKWQRNASLGCSNQRSEISKRAGAIDQAGAGSP